jgi:hypothetical protein
MNIYHIAPTWQIPMIYFSQFFRCKFFTHTTKFRFFNFWFTWRLRIIYIDTRCTWLRWIIYIFTLLSLNFFRFCTFVLCFFVYTLYRFLCTFTLRWRTTLWKVINKFLLYKTFSNGLIWCDFTGTVTNRFIWRFTFHSTNFVQLVIKKKTRWFLKSVRLLR